VQIVMKSGTTYDPRALLEQAKGKIGFSPKRPEATTRPADAARSAKASN